MLPEGSVFTLQSIDVVAGAGKMEGVGPRKPSFGGVVEVVATARPDAEGVALAEVLGGDDTEGVCGFDDSVVVSVCIRWSVCHLVEAVGSVCRPLEVVLLMRRELSMEPIDITAR